MNLEFHYFFQILLGMVGHGYCGSWPRVKERANAGVMFRLDQKVLVKPTLERDLIFIIPLPVLDRKVLEPVVNPCVVSTQALANPELCLMIRKFVSLYGKVLERAELRLNATLSTLSEYFVAPVSRQRARWTRIAPLGFIGSLSRTIFGTATIDDVLALNAKVDSIHKTLQSGQEFLKDSMLHLINSTSTDLTKIHGRLSGLKQMTLRNIRQTSILRGALQSLDRNMTKQVTWETYFTLYLSYLELRQTMVDQLERHSQQWITSMEMLSNGKLSSNLVSITQVKSAISEVTSKLGSDIKLCITDPKFVYSDMVSTYQYTSSHLYVHITLPTSNKGCIFRLYSIFSWSVPLITNTTKGYTLIKNSVKKLAISSDGQEYIDLTDDDFNDCLTGYYLQCPHLQQSRSSTSMTCSWALWQDNVTMITNLCMYTVRPNDNIPTVIKHIYQSKFVFATPSTKVIMTDQVNRSTTEVPCTYCTLTIPCDKTVTIDSILVYPHTSCDKTPVMFNVELVNLPLLSVFNISWKKLTAEMTVDKPVNIKLPKMFYDKKTIGSDSDDAEIKLKTLADRIKQHFEDQDRQKYSFDPLPSWFGFKVLISFKVVVGIALLVLPIPGYYAMIKVRKVIPFLMAQHMILPTSAEIVDDDRTEQDYDAIIYPPKSNPIIDTGIDLSEKLRQLINKLDYNDRVLTIILAVMIIYILRNLVKKTILSIFRLCKSKMTKDDTFDMSGYPTPQTTVICYRLGIPECNAFIPVLKLVAIPSSVQVCGVPAIMGLRVKQGWFRSIVTIDMTGHFKLTVGGRIIFKMPLKSVCVTRAVGKQIKIAVAKSMHEDYAKHFVFNTGDSFTQIECSIPPEVNTPVCDDPPQYHSSLYPSLPMVTPDTVRYSVEQEELSTPLFKSMGTGKRKSPYDTPSWSRRTLFSVSFYQMTFEFFDTQN